MENKLNKKMPWFRMYVDVLNDPKAQMLPPDMFKHWINLLCVASNNDGELHETLHKTAFHLRQDVTETERVINHLADAGLLDDVGGVLKPHNWEKRQYKSDGSAERVKKHREKRKQMGLKAQNGFTKKQRAEIYEKDGNECVYCKTTEGLTIDHKTPEIRGGSNEMPNLQTACRQCNADKRNMTHEEYLNWEGRVTFQETDLQRPQRTETETEEELKKYTKKEPSPSQNEKQEAFEAWYSRYPLKKGRKQAEKAWAKLTPVEMQLCIDVVNNPDFEAHMNKQVRGTQDFRKHPSTWLNGGCWEDEMVQSYKSQNGDPF